VGRAEYVGALGHEMHAAKDDVIGLGTCGCQLGQFERVAAKIGVLDDLVTLVVMPQNDEPLAKHRPGGSDTLV